LQKALISTLAAHYYYYTAPAPNHQTGSTVFRFGQQALTIAIGWKMSGCAVKKPSKINHENTKQKSETHVGASIQRLPFRVFNLSCFRGHIFVFFRICRACERGSLQLAAHGFCRHSSHYRFTNPGQSNEEKDETRVDKAAELFPTVPHATRWDHCG